MQSGRLLLLAERRCSKQQSTLLSSATLPPPQALANTLWGLSKLGIKAEGLMEGIGQAAHSQIYDYNSQNLANSVRPALLV